MRTIGCALAVLLATLLASCTYEKNPDVNKICAEHYGVESVTYDKHYSSMLKTIICRDGFFWEWDGR